MSRTVALALLALAALAPLAPLVGGCNDAPAPRQHTSLADKPAASPGKPKKKVPIVWLHHGCTGALLRAGLARALDKNNTPVISLSHGQGKVPAALAPKGAKTANDRYVIGDHARPADFAAHVRKDALLAAMRQHGANKGAPHRVIAFNSCHGVLRLRDDAALARLHKTYNKLLAELRSHQQILFVVLTMPPLTAALSDKKERARARKLAQWLAKDWGQRAPNVRVFDLFDALAVRSGHALADTLAPQFAHSARDPRPTKPAAAKAVARLFVPWLDLALKTRGL